MAGGDDPGPTDAALAEYIGSRLERMSPVFADPEIVREALTYYRDLWATLYAIDNGEPASALADPPS